MPVVKTVVEDRTKALFRAIAKEQGCSESELLRRVVLVVTGEESEGALVESSSKKNEVDRMTVRMPIFLKDEVKRRAKGKGMNPSRWVSALIQSNLMADPVLTDRELIAVNNSNRELAAIGRNINQIAKALNEAFHETERVRIDLLRELAQTIARNRKEIRVLVRASQQAWGQGDGMD